MWAITSLSRRLMLFLILPVAVFLAVIGGVSYLYLRQILLQQWQENAILRLERAAHSLDMRLAAPVEWMEHLAATGGSARGVDDQQWVLAQLQTLDGVRQVNLAWNNPTAAAGTQTPPRVAKVTPPRYLYSPDHRTVELTSDLLDEEGQPLGTIQVSLTYEYLMQDLLSWGWMQANSACLLNLTGQYLAHTNPAMYGRHCLGDTQNPLELTMRREMQQKNSGTIVGPNQVIGFYRLEHAPWVIMLHAPTGQIMAPFWRFRLHYVLGGLLCLAAIVALIRLGLRPVVAAIQKISARAVRVAQGDYGEPLPVESADEIGRLTASFNAMVAGLKQRDFIRNTFGRYVDEEIAQKLLARPEAVRLGGEKRQVVILFADLRDFTPIAESLSPEATLLLVNRFFSRMVEVLRRHHGIIVDFLGDATLAFFDPLEAPLAPLAEGAFTCALEMQAAMGGLNRENAAQKLPQLGLGIGLHVGEVVVGNIGSESRAKYGIVGAAVNQANRLQALAQSGEVVLSEPMYRLVQSQAPEARPFTANLKGIAEEMPLYVINVAATRG